MVSVLARFLYFLPSKCTRKRKRASGRHREMSMSFVCMVEAELPPGFRFHPRDDELIREYLAPKVFGRIGFSGHRPPMVDVDLNKVEPWDLPSESLFPRSSP